MLDTRGDWLGLLLFAAASRRLRHRDRWIGWSDEQRRRRLPLVVNNTRFLLLPDKTTPNLGSAVLSRVAARLSDDWTDRYGHPVLVVETFVDPRLYRGTVYQAAGWTQLGQTRGHQRISRDYYEPHDRPKLLFARELARGARRSLQAERLKPALAALEAATPPRCTESSARLKSLSQGQLKALGVRRDTQTRRYSSPDQTTFSRLMSNVDAGADCSFTIKENTPELKKRIETKVPDPGSPLLYPRNTPVAAPDTVARKRKANG